MPLDQSAEPQSFANLRTYPQHSPTQGRAPVLLSLERAVHLAGGTTSHLQGPSCPFAAGLLLRIVQKGGRRSGALFRGWFAPCETQNRVFMMLISAVRSHVKFRPSADRAAVVNSLLGRIDFPARMRQIPCSETREFACQVPEIELLFSPGRAPQGQFLAEFPAKTRRDEFAVDCVHHHFLSKT
jgi:hypothetical protein